jgi:predicted Zn-ribbon and HTH transcriptional regulator
MDEENKLSNNNNSEGDMHICATVTEREIDIEKERVEKGEVAGNSNSSSILTGNIDDNTHMHTSLNRLKDISIKDGRIHLWIGIGLKKAVLKAGIDVSEFVRNKLLEELKNRNVTIEEKEPELIVRVRCCHCGFEQNTSTLKMVKCINCGHSFRVFTKWGCRIRKIVKGDQNLLTKMFYQTYKHRRVF